jgi:hypothetical protein
MEKSKRRRWLHVPSPAMIVACVALFIAMGGTSYAAATLAANSVGSKQLKKNAVTSAKIKNAAVTGAKVKDGTLAGTKLADATIATAKLADASVTGAKLADASVDAAKVGAIPGARVRRTAAQSVANNATLVVPYDTVDFNVGGVYNAAQPTRMTAPIPGRYLIVATARWQNNDQGRRTIALEVNGTAAQIARSNVSPYSAGGVNPLQPEQTAQAVYKLNAGDYVEVWAYQDSGVALGLLSAIDNGVTFSMQWLAP